MSRGLALVAVIAMAMVAGPACAQPQHRIQIIPIHPPNPPMHNPHGYRHARLYFPTPEQRAANLAQLLNLSEEQKEQVQKIFLDQDKQTSAVSQDNSLTVPERTKKLDAVRDGAIQQVRAVLTDAQRKKYDALAPQPKAAAKYIELVPE